MQIYKSKSSCVALILGIICSIQIAGVNGIRTSFYGTLSSSNYAFGDYTPSLPNSYFQAYTLTPTTTGLYMIVSDSPIDPYGYLYRDTFNPANINLNLIVKDDDSAGNYQFGFNQTLVANNRYILVVSTFNERISGSFSVNIEGPASISYSIFNPVPPSTTRPLPTTSPTVQAFSFSGVLTTSSVLFSQPNRPAGVYYAQAYQLVTSVSGRYTFTSSSSIDTMGYLYQSTFYPTSTTTNLLAFDDDSGGDRQFSISFDLVAGRTYYLFVSTYPERTTGTFTIRGTGPTVPSSSSYVPPSIGTSTASGPIVQFYGYLSSSRFNRPGGNSPYYYYEALRIQIPSTTYITMTTQSSIDTYGCLYSGSFDPSYPNNNLVACDDDSGGSSQFSISRTLTAGQQYTLVVTTYGTSVSGSYTGKFIGSNQLTVTSYTPVTSRPIATTTSWYYDYSVSFSTAAIVGIVFGSIFLVVIIGTVIGAVASRNNRTHRPVVHRQVIANAAPQYQVRQPQVAIVSGTTVGAGVHKISMEETPPAYNSLDFNKH